MPTASPLGCPRKCKTKRLGSPTAWPAIRAKSDSSIAALADHGRSKHESGSAAAAPGSIAETVGTGALRTVTAKLSDNIVDCETTITCMPARNNRVIR